MVNSEIKKYGIIFFLCVRYLHAQTEIFSLRPNVARDSNKTSALFERNVYTYRWNGALNYTIIDENNLAFSVKELFSSSLIKQTIGSFRDENNFAFYLSQNISRQFALRAAAESYLVSDNQYRLSDKKSLGENNTGIHSGVLGFTFFPVRNISLTPLAGVRFDKQQNEEDEGINYRILAEADSLEIGGYRAAFSARINESVFKPRMFRSNGAQLFIAKEFAENSMDSVRIRYSNNQLDFYIPAGDSVKNKFGVQSNVRSRAERIYGIQNLIRYYLGSGFSTRFTTNVESRKIGNAYRFVAGDADYLSTTVEELRLEGAWDVDYRSSNLFSSLGLAINERDENHNAQHSGEIESATFEKRQRREKKLDNTAVRTTIKTNTTAFVSPSDEIQFNGAINVLKYDTPDSSNTDDRDELLLTSSFRWFHSYNSALSFAIAAEATLAHLVYISRYKSANNNKNRILSLKPEILYHPSDKFSMYNAFEVYANYTVFDFENIIPTLNSYSYRQFSIVDSTSYNFSQTVGADFFAQVKVYERGELLWSGFSERPQQRAEEITFSPQLRYTREERFYFAFGIRSFAQKKYTYANNKKQYSGGFASIGPTTRIILRLSSQSLIEIQGWKEFQRQSGVPIKDFSNMTMNVRYFF